jgi:hypothetical protein
MYERNKVVLLGSSKVVQCHSVAAATRRGQAWKNSVKAWRRANTTHKYSIFPNHKTKAYLIRGSMR